MTGAVERTVEKIRPTMLDKETAFRALQRLAELAREKEIHLSLTIYGGTVMMLAYNARPGTKDIDAIFRPREEAKPLVEQVAKELNLDVDWLNDDVKVWVAENEQGALIPFAEMSEVVGVSVKRPSAKYMLAMKARAARLPLPGQSGDYDDLVYLLRHTKTTTLEEVDKLVETYFLQDCLPEKNRAIVEAALKDVYPS
jgi:hypothetical protein